MRVPQQSYLWRSFRKKATGIMLVEDFVALGERRECHDFVGWGRSCGGQLPEQWPSPWTSRHYHHKRCSLSLGIGDNGFLFAGDAEVRVQPPGDSELVVLGTDFSDACNVSGCTNMTFSCTPFACQPPPTTSRFPSPTVGGTPLPTASSIRSPAPSGTRSPPASENRPRLASEIPSPTASNTSFRHQQPAILYSVTNSQQYFIPSPTASNNSLRRQQLAKSLRQQLVLLHSVANSQRDPVANSQH